MITFALFVFIAAGVVLLSRLPYGGPGKAGALYYRRREACGQDALRDAALFHEFCDCKCRLRFLCLAKGRTRRDGTCREFKLDSNAPW